MSENAFNSRSKTIGELLSSNQQSRIVVPTFQRGYSWEIKHVKTFWTDINDPNRSPKYFLGPIVILNKSDTVTELLDGQQRLATATILFSVLRDVGRELGFVDANNFAAYVQRDFIIGEEGQRCLQMGELDDSYFSECVQADNAPTSKRSPKLRSQRHISQARQFLLQSVRTAISTKDKFESLKYLKTLKNFLRSDLVLACITVDSDGDAFQIFETLNDRGLRLSVPDLLLNYLMRVCPQQDRPQLRKVWNEMVMLMGRRDISRFLRHLWVSRYGDLKTESLFSALKSEISKQSISSVDFVQACATECQNYMALLTFSEEQIGSAAPYVRSLIQGIDAQSSLPMLLSAYTKFTPADFTNITKWLLVFVTRWSVLLGLESSELETQLFALARSIRNISDKDEKAKQSKVKEVKETLRKLSPDHKQIDAAAERLILPPESAAYVIRKLSDAMESKTKEKGTGHESNLEHIYPQNPDEGTWGGESGQAALEPYTWHIGNLTMLGERLNTKVKNEEYPVKRAKYASSELVMAQSIAKKYAVWDRSTIEDRAKTLAPWLKQIWNFDNPSQV
ncbi:MAG: DUF262 domain-containing HNH endonuclease family protein [Acidobacteriia bacterium]|nr:DUF262 domain-containing HNH endonuclease family protein [Terriglobia bacterium]